MRNNFKTFAEFTDITQDGTVCKDSGEKPANLVKTEKWPVAPRFRSSHSPISKNRLSSGAYGIANVSPKFRIPYHSSVPSHLIQLWRIKCRPAPVRLGPLPSICRNALLTANNPNKHTADNVDPGSTNSEKFHLAFHPVQVIPVVPLFLWSEEGYLERATSTVQVKVKVLLHKSSTSISPRNVLLATMQVYFLRPVVLACSSSVNTTNIRTLLESNWSTIHWAMFILYIKWTNEIAKHEQKYIRRWDIRQALYTRTPKYI